MLTCGSACTVRVVVCPCICITTVVKVVVEAVNVESVATEVAVYVTVNAPAVLVDKKTKCSWTTVTVMYSVDNTMRSIVSTELVDEP